MRESETDGQTLAAASYYRHVTQKFHGNRIFISRMLNRNPKRLSAEVFFSAQKQPKQNASSQNREENGSTTLRNTREKPLLAGYLDPFNTGPDKCFNGRIFYMFNQFTWNCANSVTDCKAICRSKICPDS